MVTWKNRARAFNKAKCLSRDYHYGKQHKTGQLQCFIPFLCHSHLILANKRVFLFSWSYIAQPHTGSLLSPHFSTQSLFHQIIPWAGQVCDEFQVLQSLMGLWRDGITCQVRKESRDGGRGKLLKGGSSFCRLIKASVITTPLSILPSPGQVRKQEVQEQNTSSHLCFLCFGIKATFWVTGVSRLRKAPDRLSLKERFWVQTTFEINLLNFLSSSLILKQSWYFNEGVSTN